MPHLAQRRVGRRTLIVLPLAAFAAVAPRDSVRSVEHAPKDQLTVSTSGWRTDFSKHSVSLSEFRSGGPPRDGIPPIDHPQYIAQAEADTWLDSREPVIAVALEQPDGALAARAYPLQILVWHEIVNDVLGDTPVAITFCPLCYTAIAFDRRLERDGVIYDFGATGNLRYSDLVMWDRQTESWWQQFSGDAIVGELTGAHLTILPAQIVSWESFREAYPNGDVLSRDTGFDRSYGVNPYPGYDDIDSRPFLFNGETDNRLAAMERVVGVITDDAQAAYPLQSLQRLKLAEDRLGDMPIVVFWIAGTASAVDTRDIAEGRDVGQVGVFQRVFGEQIQSFSAGPGDRFTDAETGSEWTVLGQAVAGAMEGARLAPVPHTVVFWFAWAAFQPDGRLWQPPA